MLTIEELNNEILHCNKEVNLLEYEVKNFGVKEDTEARLNTLIQRHFQLTMLAIAMSNQ